MPDYEIYPVAMDENDEVGGVRYVAVLTDSDAGLRSCSEADSNADAVTSAKGLNPRARGRKRSLRNENSFAVTAAA